MSTKDSNLTELRFAEEESIGVLPVTPTWKALEPNDYSSFGSTYSNTAREPIKADRQNQKGVQTGLEASVGYSTDLIAPQITDLLSAFFFANWRSKPSQAISTVTATQYTVTDNTDFDIDDLIFVQDLTTASNNGFKVVTGLDSTTGIEVSGLTVDASTGILNKCGIRASSGDLTLVVSGGNVNLNSTTLDFTTLGLVAGEWIYIGGDDTNNQFLTAANNGFYKVKVIETDTILFDQYPTGVTSDTGTGKSIDLYFGNLLKNESDPNLIIKKPIQFERKYDSNQYEYVKGCIANTLGFTIETADKITTSLEFLGLTSENLASAKAGNRPNVEFGSAYNTTSDFYKFKMYDQNGNNLASYSTSLEININNGAVANEALGTLGAFNITVGNFVVEGNIETYYETDNAANAIQNNSSVGLSFALGNFNNQNCLLFDIPYLTLGDGNVQVAKDEPIKLPLSLAAAADSYFNYTAEIINFKYLPEIAFSS